MIGWMGRTDWWRAMADEKRLIDAATKSKRVNAKLVVVSEGQTGADQRQHDNLTLGQEIMADLLVDGFGIDERALSGASRNPVI